MGENILGVEKIFGGEQKKKKKPKRPEAVISLKDPAAYRPRLFPHHRPQWRTSHDVPLPVQRHLLPHHSNTATPLSVGFSTADLPPEGEGKNNKPTKTQTKQIWRRRRKKQIREKVKKIKNDCLCFCFLQVTVGVTVGREGKRGGGCYRPPVSRFVFAVKCPETFQPLFL